jgi:hypothetical protein
VADDVVLARRRRAARGRGRRIRALELAQGEVAVEKVVVRRTKPLRGERPPREGAPAPSSAFFQSSAQSSKWQRTYSPMRPSLRRFLSSSLDRPTSFMQVLTTRDTVAEVRGSPRVSNGIERAVARLPQDQVAHPAQLRLRDEGHPLLLVEPVGPVAVRLAHEVHEERRLPGPVHADDDRVLRRPVRE